jgi:hypothetical protein
MTFVDIGMALLRVGLPAGAEVDRLRNRSRANRWRELVQTPFIDS